MTALSTKENRVAFATGKILSATVAAGLFVSALSATCAVAASSAPARSNAPASVAGCAQYRIGQLSTAARLAEPNRGRLLAAQTALAPGFDAGKASDGILLLGNYQAEMEKPHPNRTLAATYLAVASATPIDLKLVRRVNSLLCVSASTAAAQAMALIANAEWQQMTSSERARRQPTAPPDDAGVVGGGGGGEHFLHDSPGGWGVGSKVLHR